MSRSKSLKVSLKREGLNAQYGEDIEITADVSAARDAIMGVAGAIGVENCLKLGAGAAAATALYVAAKSIVKHWKWLKPTDVDQDVVMLSMSPTKEKTFDKLIEREQLQKRVADDFENLEVNLEEILSEEEYEKHGAEILNLLKDVRIGSITESGNEHSPKNILAGKVVEGIENTKEYNVRTTVLCSDKNKSASGGVVAGVYIGKTGNVSGTRYGGNVLVARGYDGENASNITKNVQGDDVKVKIMGDDMDCAFECGFPPRTTVSEVINVLKSQKDIPRDTKVTIKRNKEPLNPEWTLAHLESNGSTRNWQMEVGK